MIIVIVKVAPGLSFLIELVKSIKVFCLFLACFFQFIGNDIKVLVTSLYYLTNQIS